MADIFELSQETLSADMMAQPALLARARQAVANADYTVNKQKDDISKVERAKKVVYAKLYLDYRNTPGGKPTEKEIESRILISPECAEFENHLSHLYTDLVELERDRDNAKAVFYGIEERGTMLKSLASLEFAEIKQQDRR